MMRTLAFLIATAATACASSATAQVPKPLKTVTLVSSTVNPPSITNIYYLAAMEGAFRDHGLEVQLQQSSGSPSSVAAIISGKADFGSVAVTTLANAAAEGVKAKMVVTGNFDFPGMILSRPGLKSIKDLEGKRMGAAAIGSMEYAIAQAYLVKQGVDFSKISWVATRQTSNTVQALAAAQIDAAWLNTPSAITALGLAPNLQILVDAKTIAASSPNPGGAVVVTDRFAAQSPETVQAFVDAVIEANRALYNEQAFFDRVLDKWLPGVYSEQQRKILYDAHRSSWGVNGGLPLAVMDAALENWKININPDKAKNPHFSKASDLMDLRFARKTLDRLGKLEGALDIAEWASAKL
jgi:ABC-type nitrate/sulfonate/bicarbonate transport system substrate-binding protein